ncbi:hypothetical protein [Burkholderia gladioli]|uniref:hypothetical protein n=1 Tax=Burkholderia gladioli TaxID=28095 RepID=UPI0030BA0D61
MSVIEAIAGCAGSARTGCANVSPLAGIGAVDVGMTAARVYCFDSSGQREVSIRCRISCEIASFSALAKARKSKQEEAIRKGWHGESGRRDARKCRGSRLAKRLFAGASHFDTPLRIMHFDTVFRRKSGFSRGFARKSGSTPFARPAFRFA